MKTNKKPNPEPIFTAGGGKAVKTSKLNQLKRSVCACFLWEDSFYEEGISISDRIFNLCQEVPVQEVCSLAIEVRQKFNIRHAPLWMLVALLEKKNLSKDERLLIGKTIPEVVKRVDEIGELVSLYWKVRGRRPLAKQLKLGLGWAFNNFDEYQFSKYNSTKANVRLIDLLRIIHPKPVSPEMDALFSKIKTNTLKTADTWETALSAGANKNETFTRLLNEKKLGYTALVKNVRNMKESGVDKTLVQNAFLTFSGGEKVFPYRFITAARHCPEWEDIIDEGLVHSFKNRIKIPGKTVIVIDISGSMYAKMSAKSESTRLDAATALAASLRESFTDVSVYATSGDDYSRTHATQIVPARRGSALADAIVKCQSALGHGGIFLKQVTDFIQSKEKSVDRLIVITDEQDCSIDDKDKAHLAQTFAKNNYMLNVSSEKNGIGYGSWIHIDGFSSSVADYIHSIEQCELFQCCI